MTGTNGNKRLCMRGRPWLWLILSLASVTIDQISKWLCVTYLKPVSSVTLIPGLLKLTYLQNEGAAFGSLSDHRWIFMIFSTVAIIGVTFYLLFLSEQNRWLRASLALIVGGGIGNMIDRISLGYVIDMIDFYGIWPYIFNVADSCVCVGAGIMVLYCGLELYREYKQGSNKADENSLSESDGDKA
ncbi:MAG: signal peptidase II [Clostridia bacterium]|nr:signal peptidase II [Clostridia bacterium]